MTNTIHPTALISDKAVLGNFNQIGPYVIIEDEVSIGDNNRILARVSIKNGSQIGHGNTLHEGVIFGGDPQDLSFNGKATATQMGNDNVLREYVIIHRATNENIATTIGNNNYLMNHTHLGHDCQIANYITMAPCAAIAGHVSVEDKAFISGGVMVHQYTRIGCFAMIGGNSKITQSVLPYMITDGIPARVRGLNSIGLRRANFQKHELVALKQAYRSLFQSGLPLDDILGQFKKNNSPYLQHLASFIETQKRGFHRAVE